MSAGGVPGSPEIQQLYFPRFQKENIIRSDIPVNNPMLMYGLQAVQHAQYNGKGLFHRHFPLSVQPGLERFAIQIFHHDIGRIIFLKKVKNMGNSRNISKLRQPLGLIQSLSHSYLKLFLFVSSVNCHFSLIEHTSGKFHREIFFDRHLFAEQTVVSNIGNSKSPGAQHLSHHVSACKNRTRRNIMHLPCGSSIYIAAVGAGGKSLLILLHTAQTTHLQISHSSKTKFIPR